MARAALAAKRVVVADDEILEGVVVSELGVLAPCGLFRGSWPAGAFAGGSAFRGLAVLRPRFPSGHAAACGAIGFTTMNSTAELLAREVEELCLDDISGIAGRAGPGRSSKGRGSTMEFSVEESYSMLNHIANSCSPSSLLVWFMASSQKTL